jgi:hypothetical protein
MQGRHGRLDPFERTLMAAIIADLRDCADDLSEHAGGGSEAARRLVRCANFLGASFPEVRAEAQRLGTKTVADLGEEPRDGNADNEANNPGARAPSIDE